MATSRRLKEKVRSIPGAEARQDFTSTTQVVALARLMDEKVGLGFSTFAKQRGFLSEERVKKTLPVYTAPLAASPTSRVIIVRVDMGRFILDLTFRQYVERVTKSFRFGQDKKTRDFIEYVLDGTERRKRHIQAGEKFWRAQIGHDKIVSIADDKDEWAYDSIRPHTPQRMTPASRFVGNGRANPTGIAYWYGATDPETAIAEMRPWQGAILTVAELQATRNLQLIDCGHTRPMVAPYKDAAASERERYVWNEIGEAFSKPVAPTTIDIEYVPTQMLAEAFRTKGFDGIQYKSHLGGGMNVVVFELSAFIVGERALWGAKRVSYELERHGEEMREY